MRLPKHIGIIPDGNRRWASGHGLNKEDGYAYGLDPGLQLLKKLQSYGVAEITYYGFTMDNCKRPHQQVTSFQQACIQAVKMISTEDISLLVFGNHKSNCFPRELLSYTTRNESDGKKIKVNFLVNYGWEWDIAGINENGKLRSAAISRVDLIIRWGGMRRLSGFLPIQSVYADFYIIDAMWPEYQDTHLTEALAWYDRQDITLGG